MRPLILVKGALAVAAICLAEGTPVAQAQLNVPAERGEELAITTDLQTLVMDVQTLLVEGDHLAAISRLQSLGNTSKMPSYDQTVIEHLYVQAHLGAQDYGKATHHFERVIAAGTDFLPEKLVNQLLHALAGIYIAASTEADDVAAQIFLDKGISILEPRLRENPDIETQAYASLAYAYLALSSPNYDKAIEWLERGIAKVHEMGEMPNVQWYRNLAAIYQETGQPHKASAIQELLIWNYDEPADAMPPSMESTAWDLNIELSSYVPDDIDRGAYPKFRVQHQFPRRALDRGISGCVIFGFTVTETGQTRDVYIIDSSNEMFERYGIRAIEQYQYEPLVIIGRPTATPNQTIRLVWEVEGERLPDHPACEG